MGRKRAERRCHVWSCDFVVERIEDGRPSRTLVVVDECTRGWPARLGVHTLYLAPGSPWEKGYVESLIGKLRDELLNGEIFYTLKEARILIERWRREYKRMRPHSSLGYRPLGQEGQHRDPGYSKVRSLRSISEIER